MEPGESSQIREEKIGKEKKMEPGESSRGKPFPPDENMYCTSLAADDLSLYITGDQRKENRQRKLPDKQNDANPEGVKVQEQCRIDPQLHRDTIEGGQGKFMETLMRLSTAKGLSAISILTQVTPPGDTVLHLAAHYGHSDLVEYLASDFPSLMVTTNRRGDTPLIAAARSGQVKVAKSISTLAKDSDRRFQVPELDLMLKMTNKDGNTALHEALIAEHDEVVNFMLEEGIQVVFCSANKEKKTPFVIAIETVRINIVKKMLQLITDDQNSENPMICQIVGESPVNAAIKTMNTDMLLMVCKEAPSLVDTRDEGGGTPLHCAASVGFYKGAAFLLKELTKLNLIHDEQGLLPIHVASQKGHMEMVKMLLAHYHEAKELVTSTRGENILHIASKFGRIDIVRYVLETPSLEGLINQRDDNGNTPLHIATRSFFPRVVSRFTWDKRVKVNLINDDGMTPLDIVEKPGRSQPSYRKILTWKALKAAGGEGSKNHIDSDSVNQIVTKDGMTTPSTKVDYKDRVNTLLLVSTLVATVSFAAGFTMPGGYNSSTPDQGQAIMLKAWTFQVFLICNTIAMYSALIAAVTLLWAQLGDVHLVLSSLSVAVPVLALALSMMAAAFLSGVLTVISKLDWLYHLILILGVVFIFLLLLIFTPFFFPIDSKNYVMRYISYYIFQLMLIAYGRHDDHEQQDLGV